MEERKKETGAPVDPNQAALDPLVSEAIPDTYWITQFVFMMHICQANIHGFSPLHLAVLVSLNPNVLRILLVTGAQVNRVDKYGRTALHLVPDVNMLSPLLEAKANIDQRDEKDQTPLHYAAHRGSLGIVHALLEAKAEVSPVSRSGVTPFALAAAYKHSLVAFALLCAKANLEQASQPLLAQKVECLAAIKPHSAVIRRRELSFGLGFFKEHVTGPNSLATMATVRKRPAEAEEPPTKRHEPESPKI